MVLTGAEAVVESGGIINKIGTYQMTLLAGVKGKVSLFPHTIAIATILIA